MTEPTRLSLPDWPRLMPEPMAAAYLGISGSTLRTLGLPVRHIGRAARWDRRDLDRWADALAGVPLDETQRKGEADDITTRLQGRLAHGSR